MTIREIAEAIADQTGEPIPLLIMRLLNRVSRHNIPYTWERCIVREDGKTHPVRVFDDEVSQKLITFFVSKYKLKSKEQTS